jgi:hypothetical protein
MNWSSCVLEGEQIGRVLASNRPSVFFCMVSVSPQNINVISIDQKLMCPIQFQPFLFLLDPPDGIFQSKVEKQW